METNRDECGPIGKILYDQSLAAEDLQKAWYSLLFAFTKSLCIDKFVYWLSRVKKCV